MSADSHAIQGSDHGQPDKHAHDHGDDVPHGSLKGYLIGFGLSVVLTAVPFWLVMTGALSTQATALTIMALAAVQVVVHMVFFLHMNRRAEGGWSMMALIFTAVVVVIALSGSLWVMYHMNLNMMPTPEVMSQMG